MARVSIAMARHKAYQVNALTGARLDIDNSRPGLRRVYWIVDGNMNRVSPSGSASAMWDYLDLFERGYKQWLAPRAAEASSNVG